MTLDEQIEKLDSEIRSMRRRTETQWGVDMLTKALVLVEIVKEQQKEIQSLKNKDHKPRQRQ